MILSEDIYRIGYLSKPHGLCGEINFHFDNDFFDNTDCPYLVLNVDGILVPFFIKEYRFKGADIALIRFEGIDTADKAVKIQGCEVFFPTEYGDISAHEAETIENTWFQFLGYEVCTQNQTSLGNLSQIDTQTINVLLLITNTKGDELIIPAVESWIMKVDEGAKLIQLSLPEGLIENDIV